MAFHFLPCWKSSKERVRWVVKQKSLQSKRLMLCIKPGCIWRKMGEVELLSKLSHDASPFHSSHPSTPRPTSGQKSLQSKRLMLCIKPGCIWRKMGEVELLYIYIHIIHYIYIIHIYHKYVRYDEHYVYVFTYTHLHHILSKEV